MVSGVSSMAAGGMGMMSCLFVLAAFVMFGCFSVMAGCTSMMLRSLSVMFGCFFRHAMFLLLPILTYRELRRSFQIARGLERTLRPSRKFRASSGCVRAGSSLEPWHHRRKSEGQEHDTGRAPRIRWARNIRQSANVSVESQRRRELALLTATWMAFLVQRRIVKGQKRGWVPNLFMRIVSKTLPTGFVKCSFRSWENCCVIVWRAG
jgi:hypothetical protein